MTILEILFALLKLILALLALGISTERGTQLVKEFLRALGGVIPALNFSDRRSFFLAALVAGAIAYYFNIDVTRYLHLLDGYDQQIINMINTLIILFTSNFLHDRFASANVGG